MDMVEPNPFIQRGPIHNPASFFGRAQEITDLFDLLHRDQSVSISGQRRIGKTSLLFYAATAETAQRFGLDPIHTQWIYLDGGMLDGLNEDWLYGAIAQALGSPSSTASYSEMIERLRIFATQDRRLIIVLDEFELFARNSELQPRVFTRLRSIAAQFPVQFVVVSRDPLASLTLAHPEVVSSPFFNFFAPLRLGLFRREEAFQMLTHLSTQTGQAFAAETLDFILDLVGPHPLFLQIAGYHTYAAQQGGELTSDAWVRIREQVTADLSGHLRYYWHQLVPEEQRALAVLPIMTTHPRPNVIARLSQAALIYEGGYLGTVLRDFVYEQPIDGLMRCGLLVVDEDRRLVFVDSQPIHLTQTEFVALCFFLQNPRQLLTLEDIEAALWPDEIVADSERARVVIKRLRAALGPASVLIVNQHGQGYMLGNC